MDSLKQEKYKRLEEEYKKLYKKIYKVKPIFDEILKEVALRNHASLVIVPLKSKEKTIQKAITEYGGDIKKVKDILRGSIVSRVYGRIDDILRDLKKNYKVIRIKNRFKKPGKDKYRDLLINIEIKGIVAEIQIHVKELIEIKSYLSHFFYNIRRIIQKQAKEENRDLFSWEEYIVQNICEIEEYGNEQAWNRQIAFEKGEDPQKMIFMCTGNIPKFREAKHFLPTLKLIKIELEEIQSNDHKKIVRDKIMKAFKKIDGKLLVEDVALYCDGLKGLPGPLHRFYLEQTGVKDLAKMVIATGNTKAKAVSRICFGESPSDLHFFEGVAEGDIVLPRGKNGFQWDPIFQPNDSKKTYAEMSTEEKNEISMRKLAFDKLINFLHKKYDLAL